MASPRKNGDDRLVSRTYRAAIRIGEDFITIEETIALPLDASDDEVTQAVDLGWRIYRAQREAVESQIAGIRETAPPPPPILIRDPDAPASEKQRNYIAALQEELTWSNDQLTTYAQEQKLDLVVMTKGQASTFIDGMKKLAEERATYGDSARKPGAAKAEAPASANGASYSSRPADAQPINEKQIHALERLAQQQGLDLDMESRRRFGVVIHGLTYDQASTLLREWQRPAQPRRPANEPAL